MSIEIVVRRVKQAPALLLALAFAGPAMPALADSFTLKGLLHGSTMTAEQCARYPETGVWVEHDGRGECIRYFHAGLMQEGTPVAHIWFHGDLTRPWPRRDWIEFPFKFDYEERAHPQRQRRGAERVFRRWGIPFIRFSRPGAFGSSGDHSERRKPYNTMIVVKAVATIKSKHRIARLAVSGQSGGGQLATAVLAFQPDIVCAVITSGVVAIDQRAQIRGFNYPWVPLYDPIREADHILPDPHRRIFVVGDPDDRNVPFVTQANYYEAVKALGHRVTLLKAHGRGDHGLARVGHRVVKLCVDEIPTANIERIIENAYAD